MSGNDATPHTRLRMTGSIDAKAGVFGPSVVNIYAWYACYREAYNDGDLITSLTDLSGNARNMSNLTGANRATFKKNIVNGKAVARFNGPNGMYVALATGAVLTPAAYFVVWNRTNAASNDFILGVDGGNYCYLQYGASWYIHGGGPYPSIVMNASTWTLKEAIYTGSHVYMYTNGSLSSDQTSAVDLHFQTLGNLNYTLDGDVAELIIYSGVMADSDRLQTEGYLKDLYGIV